jgi:hypothetical protein
VRRPSASGWRTCGAGSGNLTGGSGNAIPTVGGLPGPNPIRRVLSSMREHDVRALLMGGQACILYGAAEFSRDTDFAVLASPRNLGRLRSALAGLDAPVIAVPDFRADYLRRGHAVHFRVARPEVAGLRIDVMTTMRGGTTFRNSGLAERRLTWLLRQASSSCSLTRCRTTRIGFKGSAGRSRQTSCRSPGSSGPSAFPGRVLEETLKTAS